MKLTKNIRSALLFVGASVCSITTLALTETVNGITWTYTVSNGTASVGSGEYGGSTAVPTTTTGAITIPSSLGGYDVTSIGQYAFNSCSGLSGVTMPTSVTSIGECAFQNCANLTSVAIPNSVTNIGWAAFAYCSGLVNVTIPDGVTSIEQDVFAYSGLTSVTIPNSVTNIERAAFFGCTELTSVTIPDSVNAVMPATFDWCNKLWANWYRTLANISAAGGEFSGGGVSSEEMPYALTNAPMDRAIASVTVNEDCAIDEFVLKDGKVYDSVICVKNTSDGSVSLSLPSGYSYVTVAGQRPLTIPANSTCLVSITRIAERKFLVSRQQLEEL